MSYDALRKQFLRHTGETPARYRTQKRIAVAADLLLHTSMSIKQIAANLNFCSEFHFSQKFKQIKGVSPREFRRLR